MSDLKKIANHLKAMEAFLGEDGQGSVSLNFYSDSNFYLSWEMWGQDWAHLRSETSEYGFRWVENPEEETESEYEELTKIFNNLNEYWKANKDDFIGIINSARG